MDSNNAFDPFPEGYPYLRDEYNNGNQSFNTYPPRNYRQMDINQQSMMLDQFQQSQAQMPVYSPPTFNPYQPFDPFKTKFDQSTTQFDQSATHLAPSTVHLDSVATQVPFKSTAASGGYSAPATAPAGTLKHCNDDVDPEGLVNSSVPGPSMEESGAGYEDACESDESIEWCTQCYCPVGPKGAIGLLWCACEQPRDLNEQYAVGPFCTSESSGRQGASVGSDGYVPSRDRTAEVEASSGDSKTGAAPAGSRLIPGLDQFDGKFASLEEAHKLIFETRHKVDVENDDVEDVERETAGWARKVINAMKTLPNASTNPAATFFDTICGKGYDPNYIMARAWDIVGRVIDLHKSGSELQPVQLKRRKIEQCKASERLCKLEDVLFNNKNVVKDVLDGWKIDAVVAEPLASKKASKATFLNNQRKKKQVEEMKA